MLKLYCMRDAVFSTHTVINISPWSVLLYLGVTSAAFSDKKSKYWEDHVLNTLLRVRTVLFT